MSTKRQGMSAVTTLYREINSYRINCYFLHLMHLKFRTLRVEAASLNVLDFMHAMYEEWFTRRNNREAGLRRKKGALIRPLNRLN